MMLVDPAHWFVNLLTLSGTVWDFVIFKTPVS